MKVINQILGKLHLLLVLWTLWGVYERYEAHSVAMEEISGQIPSMESEIAQLKKRLAAIDTYKKNLESSKKSVEEVFKNIEKVQRQLPQEVNDIDILDFIARESRQLNIPEMTSKPLGEVPDGFSITKPYELKARGTFLQLVVFLERLSRADRIFNVQKFTLVSDATPQKGRFQVINLNGIIETYKYNQNYKESSGVEEISAGFNGAGGGEAPRKRKRKRKQGGGGGGDE